MYARIAACLVMGVALAVAAPAAGAPRVAIGGVRNDPDGRVAASLARSVCGRLECVAPALVHERNRIDFATARRNGVQAILFGTVSQRAGGRVLALALLRDSLKPQRTWALRVSPSGRVEAAGVAAEVATLLGGASAGTRAAGPAPAVADDGDAPSRAPASTRAGVGPATERGGSRGPSVGPRRGLGAAGPVERGALTLGTTMLQRRLAYQGTPAAGGPQGLSGGVLVTPTLRVDAFPWAGSEGWLAGLGAFGSYGLSVGFKAEDAAGTKYGAQYTALAVGVAYRFAAAAAVTVAPTLAYRRVTFAVSKRSAAVAALPDTTVAGPALGADLDLAITDRLRLLGSAAITLWTTADDLVGGGKFSTGGSAYAIGGSAGLSFAVARALGARALLDYEQTRYSLRGTGTYPSTGATDRFLGGRIELRWSF